MKNHRNIIDGSYCANILRSSYSASNRCALITIRDTLYVELTLDTKIFVVSSTFPAKYAAPPCDTWSINGDLLSLAASNEATTVDDDVTF